MKQEESPSIRIQPSLGASPDRKVSLGGTTNEERASNVENKIQQCFSKLAPTSSKDIFSQMKARADEVEEAQKAQLK